MTELRALTGVRGLAAWAVVLYHLRLSIAGLPPAIERVLAKGYLAVDFFFLLSGFVIWLAWRDRVRQPGGVARFLWKRVARVWPLHVAMLAASAALALLLVVTNHADPADYRWADLPLHLLLVHSWIALPLAWNVPGWSISAEAAAYLLFAPLGLWVDWRRWSTPALVAMLLALGLGLHFVMAGQPTLGADIPRFGLLRCVVEFAAGTLLAALHLRPGRARTPALLAAACLLAWGLGAPETLAVPAAFAAALLALARTAGRPHHPLEGRAIHYLGAISYATYLAHYVGWQAWKLAFVARADAVPAWSVAAFLLTLLAASALLYERLERPAQRWLEARRPERSPTPAHCRGSSSQGT